MFNKTSIVRSILLQKCPQCHTGNMFTFNTYNSKFMRMKSRCAHCGLDFCQEPSFYFGAMYFSYAIQTLALGLVYLFLRFTVDPGIWTYAVWAIIACILIIPINYRLSRVMWIYLFIPFRGNNRRWHIGYFNQGNADPDLLRSGCCNPRKYLREPDPDNRQIRLKRMHPWKQS